MDPGDWAQSIIGGIGILATLFVGWMVYRLERRDRVAERSEEQREAAQRDEAARQQEAARVEAARRQEAARTEAEAERERRALRREQHRDDYRAATHALNHLSDVFEKAKTSFLTNSEVEAAGVDEAIETLTSIARRVPALSIPLGFASAYAGDLAAIGAPESREFAYVLRQIESDPVAEGLSLLTREAITNAREQHKAALDGIRSVEEARQAISAEWGT